MAPITTSLAWLAFAAQAIAAPTIVVDHVDNVNDLVDINDSIGCSGLMRKAICCEGSVIGLVHTGCVAPFPAPANYSAFVLACNAVAKTAQCCTLNLVGLVNIHTYHLYLITALFITSAWPLVTRHVITYNAMEHFTNNQTARQRPSVQEPRWSLVRGFCRAEGH